MILYNEPLLIFWFPIPFLNEVNEVRKYFLYLLSKVPFGLAWR